MEKSIAKKSNMNPGAELIFSKELDKEMSVECYVNSDNDYYYWELNLTGKANRTIDKFRINKLKLREYSRFANRPNFYKQFRIISVFKDSDNLVFLVDKFGQVDVHIYSLSEKGSTTIISVKKYELSPMDVMLLGEDFQDVKIVGNTIYTLSIDLGGAPSLYFISVIDLSDKKVLETSVDISSEGLMADQNNNNKTIVQLESSYYQLTGSGLKFSLLNDNLMKIEQDKLKSFVRINFNPSKIDNDENINSIIQNNY
jgi:hypothetical protein